MVSGTFDFAMMAENIDLTDEEGYAAERALRFLDLHGNQALRYHLGLVNPFGIDRATLVQHRALSDVIVTAAIFFEFTKHARWPELVQWSAEPTLMTYLRFGMHRGERFDAVPGDFLGWIVEGNHDLSDDVRFSARYWLDRKGCA